nr:hypothetical protein CFP56_12978 [Quercus suber]
MAHPSVTSVMALHDNLGESEFVPTGAVLHPSAARESRSADLVEGLATRGPDTSLRVPVNPTFTFADCAKQPNHTLTPKPAQDLAAKAPARDALVIPKSSNLEGPHDAAPHIFSSIVIWTLSLSAPHRGGADPSEVAMRRSGRDPVRQHLMKYRRLLASGGEGIPWTFSSKTMQWMQNPYASHLEFAEIPLLSFRVNSFIRQFSCLR